MRGIAALASGGMAAVTHRHPVWRPPPLSSSRPNSTAVAESKADAQFSVGEHFRVVARQSGSVRVDLPVFTAVPSACGLDKGPEEGLGSVERVDVPGVPGAFLLRNLLSPAECRAMISMSEAMGYTEDAPVSLGRNIRHNENCVWIADNTLLDPIFDRCKHLLPQEVDGGAVAGLNARWRLYKYGPQDIFRAHTDGGWPGSGINSEGQLEHDLYQDRWSQLSFVMYLNSDFDGGETSFFIPAEAGGSSGPDRQQQGVEVFPVAAEEGSALCFFHGQHPLSPLHEGSLVCSGTKYIVRSDVLYMI